ncbi:hypothetical protein [Cyanobium sp. NIES-981]|uniref:hypothetical protein n=1 Tax=Cyanobium sp. NIES-981 TaxID=1851505 RepID=UPI0007DD47B0|nr:hypothetical protein [Cyanobium sp. NIES-981]SBO42338.1 conserved protein of unknown function [Cyanobium sp. NIES-981]
MDALQEAQSQLAAIRADVERSNPELYRHLALYLQVLRQGLLKAIQQACFHLATQIQPDRYCRLPVRRRRELHRRMDDLARRASTLLTVEQVTAMAAQIARSDQRERLQRQTQGLEEIGTSQESSEAPPQQHGAQPPPGEWSQTPGSIHLGMAPPIDPRHLPPPAHAAASMPGGSAATGAPPPAESGPPLGSLDAMLQAFSEALEMERLRHPGSADPAVPELPEEADGFDGGAPWSEPRLPSDPTRLITWLSGYERALTRRLRNLSHALNVDCLRLGLTQGLLPVGLLDAALQGQVEMLPAPANLLRLQVPAEASAGGTPLALVAVLLRLVDLELEDPRLRTCRQRLQQHTQEVRRMAQTYRRVQRRLRTLEAERLWLEDNRTPTPQLEFPAN